MSSSLLLENARVIDGTGAPWFRGHVLIADGRIESVRREREPTIDADERIDIDGEAVCPGFVDLHSHSDLRILDEPTLEPKVKQGITTEILGQDGFSMAPMYRDGGSAEWGDHLEGLAGESETEWTWGNVADYLDAIDERGAAVNAATLVGHGTVRYDALGMADRDPTDEELARMADLVTEALEDGAIGFSTGLVYPPQVNATTREVAALAKCLVPHGRPFVAHIRSEGRWIWDAFDEFVDIGDDARIPIHVSHFKVSGRSVRGTAGRLLKLFEAARDRGVDVTADKYPYAAGNTMLTSVLPPWVHADGLDRLQEYLSDEAARNRMHREIEGWEIEGWENNAGKTGWENLVVSNVEADDLAHLNGRSIAEIAAERDVRPIDAVCDVLLEAGTGVSMITHSQSEADVREMLAHEYVAVGTDALFGGSPHPRTYGAYPRILGHYVRDENLLTLEEAIRKMTSLPARAMGLNRKGVIRPVMDADLVVFRPHVVDERATFADPRQLPSGILHVLVDGEFVVRDGELTGALPGGAIRA
ncbi:N-acyl-D-amino-acid deacylase family protein [Natrinema gelatinilyticum]|uniref:N-acyl-D-amino-acid deacylase family protein n=1 Tax=Natrinema gelatinilyticum TaxID=2961571 RepID=UPI0020C32455|nr:D-aminoacylase [Natrinema gelatinilyticum]